LSIWSLPEVALAAVAALVVLLRVGVVLAAYSRQQTLQLLRGLPLPLPLAQEGLVLPQLQTTVQIQYSALLQQLAGGAEALLLLQQVAMGAPAGARAPYPLELHLAE
jgi:hypothetical protein